MTELIWEGKYKGKKRTAPVRIALPFQTIETVNESAQQRQRTLDLFASGRPTEWRNRLIWGDKKYVLPSLLPEFSGKVNLIYIDPPFDTGADFSFTVTIPDNPETAEDETSTFVKKPSIIEQKAYRDTWGKGLESYLQWIYETAILLRELLAENGTIYVHLDWHVGHYVKTVFDEVFGYENFSNEIVWAYFAFKRRTAKKFPMKHDTLFSWTKTDSYIWNTQYKPHRKEYLKRWKEDKDGRYYRDDVNPTKGGTRTIYLDDLKGDIVDSVWDDIPPVNPMAKERAYYDTQKPKALLERIIKASSNKGDLVLDCFVGSGTASVVAEEQNRRWIACDLSRFAIHLTRKRLLDIENIKPFVVQNLGKYELQQWIDSEFSNIENRHIQEKAYRNFIIELNQAQSITGYNWLHGAKSGRMIHVGSVDAPISIGDIKAIIQEFWKTVGKSADVKTNGVDVLGWDFAFEINETAKQFAAENKVDLKFRKIPREVLDKKAVEQGDIKFYEMASLDIKLKQVGRKVNLALDNFIVPPDDVPEDIQKNITHWRQWIDYWAVDWNYRDDTFHNEWQSYRTRSSSKIELNITHDYVGSGKYTILVKVIDILGNDTTKAINVEIK